MGFAGSPLQEGVPIVGNKFVVWRAQGVVSGCEVEQVCPCTGDVLPALPGRLVLCKHVHPVVHQHVLALLKHPRVHVEPVTAGGRVALWCTHGLSEPPSPSCCSGHCQPMVPAADGCQVMVGRKVKV
jgi:hypothetical protein